MCKLSVIGIFFIGLLSVTAASAAHAHLYIDIINSTGSPMYLKASYHSPHTSWLNGIAPASIVAALNNKKEPYQFATRHKYSRGNVAFGKFRVKYLVDNNNDCIIENYAGEPQLYLQGKGCPKYYSMKYLNKNHSETQDTITFS